MNEAIAEKKVMKIRAVVLCLIISIFPMFCFFQMNLFNVLGNYWVKASITTSDSIGYYSAAYIYGDAAMLLFAGLLLDRFSIAKLIFFAMILKVTSIAMILTFQTPAWIIAFRILGGFGHAFALLSAFRLAILLFDEHHHGLMIGLVLTIALLGGTLAQAPLDRFIYCFGWQTAILTDFFVGLALLIVIPLILNSNKNYIPHTQHQGFNAVSYFRDFKIVARCSGNYLCAIYICLLSLPLMLLGAVWGDSYLKAHFHINEIQSSIVISLLFIGLIIGFPCIGFLSDLFKNRRNSMIVGATATLMMLGLILYANISNVYCISALFLALGFLSSSQIIGYTVLGEINTAEITSTAMGFSNVLLMSFTATIQLIFNSILHTQHNLDFHAAMLFLIILVGISAVIPFFIKIK